MKKILLAFTFLFCSQSWSNEFELLTSISLERAQEVFKTQLPSSCFLSRTGAIMRLGKVRPAPQCFERAQVWSYALEKQLKVDSFKYFLFFSKAYRNKCHYKWKFHVAPAVVVRAGESTVPMVMDRVFSKSGPQRLYKWTKKFIRPNNREDGCVISDTAHRCEVINYSDFMGYDHSEYHQFADGTSKMCFIVQAPSYAFYTRELEPANQHEIQNTSSRQTRHAARSFNLLKRKCQKRFQGQAWYERLNIK